MPFRLNSLLPSLRSRAGHGSGRPNSELDGGRPRTAPPPLPAFVIIGTQKAGTTSLRTNLMAHPEVFMPNVEPKFFNENYERGVDWYRSLFAEGRGRLCGEKTPDYMRTRRSMERLRALLPDARLIVLLRDPVKRLFSELNHQMMSGALPRPQRVDARFLRELAQTDTALKAVAFDSGFYLRNLEENVLPLFPAARLLVRATDRRSPRFQGSELRAATGRTGVFLGEDRNAYTREVLDDICAFLGIAKVPADVPMRASNIREYAAPITDDARAFATEFYAKETERLFAFLGEKFETWGASFDPGRGQAEAPPR